MRSVDNAFENYLPGKDIAAMTTQYLSHELILSTSPFVFTLKEDFLFCLLVK